MPHLPQSNTSSTVSSLVSSAVTLVNGTSETSNGISFEELEGKELSEQLEILDKKLVQENRIKDGAENLLSMALTDELRQQVVSELSIASSNIEAITKKKTDIEHILKVQKAQSNQSKRKEEADGDDFRTALRNAQSCVSTLTSLNASIPAPSDPSPSAVLSNSPDLDRQLVEVMTKLVQIFQRNLRVRYGLETHEVVQAVIPALADRRSKQCRAVAYRVIRHALVDANTVRITLEQQIDWYLVRSLHRDNKFAVEKEQAIKLIRAIVEVGVVSHDKGSRKVPLSEPVMRAFIAVAEQADDPFRLICIQTLAEIIVLDTDLVARTGGVRALLHAIGEGPLEITPLLAFTFLHLVDSPRTRVYLNVGTDLEIALSAVTDAYGKGPEHVDRMKSCTKVIQLMLRTWSGLLYFCMDGLRAIRSLVDTLRIPSLETREIVLNMFFEVFNIQTPEWHQPFLAGRRLTTYQKASSEPPKYEPEHFERNTHAVKLTDQYIGLLVLVFTKAGLLAACILSLDALTSMLEEFTIGNSMTRKATLLIGEILQLANRVLPLSIAAKIQAVPKIFTLASDYHDGEHRIVGSSALSMIDSFNRNRTRLEPSTVKVAPSRIRANSVDDAIRRGQRQVEQVKIKMGMQMDDRTFQSYLLDTQVMATRDHAKWNFDILQELIEGPLLNPKRMEEAIKGARFMRRLMAFFHPFGGRFSTMHRRVKVNHRWVRLGCSLLTTFMASTDGIRYLSSEDPFMGQIAKCFAQLHGPESDPAFSKKRIADTLTYGYLEMLGTLSKHKEGIEILEKHNIFNAFYHLSDLKNRDDLIRGVIEHLDYTTNGHPRIILSKALTSSNKETQKFATALLGELIRNSSVNAWTLRLLMTQLYDPAPEVRAMAVHYLEAACESKEILELVVEMQPTMSHLGDVGNSLLLKFMSTPTGFRYLYGEGYIDREMDIWFNERNIYYVVQVEVFLAQVFNSSSEDDDYHLVFEGTVPPHFYGEMVKTELGCQILQEKGHFVEFAQFIRQHAHESEDPELIMKLKSVLWAVGNVGSTEGGLPFLEEEEIIPFILEIANQSLIPSLRGTCFFALGLISSTSQGAEILDDYQWEATLSPMGMPTGLCIPVEVDRFISLPSWKAIISEETNTQLMPPTSDPEVEVITAIQNLANSVIANAASRSLAKMKSRPEYRAIFSSPAMFFRVLHIISTSRYRLPVRRYIMDLFNVELDAKVVATFVECARTLKASPSYRPPESDLNRRFSIFGRARNPEESDEDDEVDEEPPPLPNIKREQPPLNLRPVSRIVGFRSS
ncbi:hypothetical protein K435DRAFT_827891 [Dendrothele bispora CBS 962.96]|uniref:REM-1 domain-containing protein n=1 Tax=Dendrothele bispora (strain CBS 962.96) TaxID=1314807 RepID=A0A4S8MEN1_DENBC|nr:hypothetical protein K435DRAFT_827891 [Dendrothele bispora CBS 962.96]